MHSKKHLWVVILAAGEGTRVMGLTHDRWGRPAPKQYSLVDGHTTLLETTLKRANRIVPAERIVAIVARQHRRWWVSELTAIPAQNVIIQPENRGTAAGILLPLARIYRRDPDARLLILPSDHGVSSEETLHTAIIDAASCTACSDAGMVLLGVQPECSETGYGWIVPRSGGTTGLRPVASFYEKPDTATAVALLKQGALVNSFVLIAGGRFLLDLFQAELPQLWRAFQPMLDGMPDDSWIEQDLVRLYSSVPTLDFSKDLLERAADTLWVHSVPACGWLDLGTPDCLTGHLHAHGQQPWNGNIPRTLQMPQARPGDLEVTEMGGGTPAHDVA